MNNGRIEFLFSDEFSGELIKVVEAIWCILGNMDENNPDSGDTCNANPYVAQIDRHYNVIKVLYLERNDRCTERECYYEGVRKFV